MSSNNPAMHASYEATDGSVIVPVRFPAFWLDDMADKSLITDHDSLNVVGHNISKALVTIILNHLYPAFMPSNRSTTEK